MIRRITLTTVETPEAQAYFEDGKLFLNNQFEWRKFTKEEVVIQIEDADQETIYTEELLAIDFCFTMLRRFNEVIGFKVQGFFPDNLMFAGNCKEFAGQTLSVKNHLMDLIGWETTWDPDEPKPVDFWRKKDVTSVSTSTGQTGQNPPLDLTTDKTIPNINIMFESLVLNVNGTRIDITKR